MVDAIEVRRLARRLKIRRAEALGLCVIFWLWADSETDDGLLPDCTPELVDDVVGHAGFAEAMIDDAKWLSWDGERLVVPNFERHMSESTKRRTLKAERQRRWRASKGAKKG